jgi:DNA polymerase elongation subunit (family B)
MFTKEYLQDLLFFDIETVAKYYDYDEFYNKEPRLADLWIDKAIKKGYYKDMEDILDKDNIVYKKYVGLYPEFSRICSISVLSFNFSKDNDEYNIRVKTINNTDETILLEELSILLEKTYNYNKKTIVTGHNIAGFDIPFLNKRFLINGLKLPILFNFFNKKPWEVNILDTMNLWKFTGTELISLDLLMGVFNIESPKTIEVNGSQVHDLFHNKEYDKIKEYNEKDVKCLSELIYKLYQIYN